MWQTLERKARFIGQVMRGRLDVREIEDVGEDVLGFAELKAIASFPDPTTGNRHRICVRRDRTGATCLQPKNRSLCLSSEPVSIGTAPAASRQASRRRPRLGASERPGFWTGRWPRRPLIGPRLRRSVCELPEDERTELIGALLDELGDDRELPEELNERLVNGMLDRLIAGKRGEREILGSDGVLGELTRRLVERTLAEELSEHLGYPAGRAPLGGVGNSRNGGSPKTVLTDNGPVRIRVPRARQSDFEPQLVKKHQRRLAGLDEKIIALYAGGMSTREIETYVSELYGPGVSRETVSRVTASVLEDAKAWQKRPLEQIHPIVYLDALVIKIRDGHAVRNFACYLAIGVNLEGERDVLGIWFQFSSPAAPATRVG